MFTLSDFGLDASYDLPLAKLLSRMTAAGEIKRVSKGKYYKPKCKLPLCCWPEFVIVSFGMFFGLRGVWYI